MSLNVYASCGQGQPLGSALKSPMAIPIFGAEHTLLGLQRQDVRGLLYCTWELDDTARYTARLAQGAGLEFVLGTRYIPGTDDNFITRCKELTNKLCLGNDKYGEFNPFGSEAFGGHFDTGLAARYIEDAAKNDYQWICPAIHPALVWDYARGQTLRGILGGTQVFCMTSYVLMGYLYADPAMRFDNDGVLAGHNLHKEYGLTIEGLQEYLGPMNVWSGAGFQQGLNAGSRIYAERLGFKGVIAGIPFSLVGTDKSKVRDKPKVYPVKLGEYK